MSISAQVKEIEEQLKLKYAHLITSICGFSDLVKKDETENKKIDYAKGIMVELGLLHEVLESCISTITKTCSSLSPQMRWHPDSDECEVSYHSGDTPWSFCLTYNLSSEVNDLNKAMEAKVRNRSLPQIVLPTVGNYVCCKDRTTCFRGFILKVLPKNFVKVLDIDTHLIKTIKTESCYAVDSEFYGLHANTIHCCLSKGVHIERKWNPVLIRLFQHTLRDSRLSMKIIEQVDSTPAKFLVQLSAYNERSEQSIINDWSCLKFLPALETIGPEIGEEELYCFLDEDVLDPFGFIPKLPQISPASYEESICIKIEKKDLPKSDSVDCTNNQLGNNTRSENTSSFSFESVLHVPEFSPGGKSSLPVSQSPHLSSSSALGVQSNSLEPQKTHFSSTNVSDVQSSHSGSQGNHSPNHSVPAVQSRYSGSLSTHISRPSVPDVQFSLPGSQSPHPSSTSLPDVQTSFPESQTPHLSSPNVPGVQSGFPRSQSPHLSSSSILDSGSSQAGGHNHHTETSNGSRHDRENSGADIAGGLNEVSFLPYNYFPKDEKEICSQFLQTGVCWKPGCAKKHPTAAFSDKWTNDVAEVFKNDPTNYVELPPIGSKRSVIVTNVVNPNSFYCIFTDSFSDYEENDEETISSLISSLNSRQTLSVLKCLRTPPCFGELIIAFCQAKQQWLRGSVYSVYTNSEIEVFFIDFGIIEDVTFDKLREIPPEYIHLPYQAVLCILYDLTTEESKENEGKQFLENFILNQEITVTVIMSSEDDAKIEIKAVTATGIDVSDLMVQRGYCSNKK